MDIDSRVDDYVVRENGDVVVSRRFYERDYGDAKQDVIKQLIYTYQTIEGVPQLIGLNKVNDAGQAVSGDARTRRKLPSIIEGLPDGTPIDDKPLWRSMGDLYQATDFNRPQAQGLNEDGVSGKTFLEDFNVGFLTAATTIDIYDKNGKYKKGWLFLAQQMHSPRDRGHAGGPYNYDDFPVTYPIDGALDGILTVNPYIYDTIVGPYQTDDTPNLDIKRKMWEKLASILNEGTEGNNTGLRYIPDGENGIQDQGDQRVTDPRHNIRLLYADYLNKGQFPSTYGDLVMTSVISHYHKEDTEDMVKQSRYILPLDMGIFTKTIDARYDALYKVVTGERGATATDVGENFCQDRDIVLFNRPYELTREKDNTIIFNKLGMEYRLKDDDLKNTLSNDLLPRIEDVNIDAMGNFTKLPDAVHDIDELNIHVQETTAKIGVGHIPLRYDYTFGITHRFLPGDHPYIGLLDTIGESTNPNTASYRVEERRSLDGEHTYLRNNAGRVTGYGDLKDFFEVMPQLKFVQKLLKPVITEYRPYSWGFNQGNRRYTASRDPGDRFDTMLLPDFKILNKNNDFQKDGSFIGSFTYKVPDDDENWHEQYHGKEYKVNVFVCKPSPSSSIAHSEKINDTAISSVYNQTTGGLPGVVLKLQLFNEEVDGIPQFCYGGNLTPQMVGVKVLLQEWSVRRFGLPDGVPDPAIDESLQKWINKSKIPTHTSRVSNSPDSQYSFLSALAKQGPVNPPCTWKQLYLTLDYGELRYQNYYRDAQIISTTENRGKDGIRRVAFIKKHDESYKSTQVNYTRFVNNAMSVGVMIPYVDQAYEVKGYRESALESEEILFVGAKQTQSFVRKPGFIALEGSFHTKSELRAVVNTLGFSQANVRAYLAKFGGADDYVYQIEAYSNYHFITSPAGDNAPRVLATRVIGSYQSKITQLNAYYAFHDFIVPDIISCLGKTFHKISDENTELTRQAVATGSSLYFDESDPQINDAASAYISLRFFWPLLGQFSSRSAYARVLYHNRLNWSSIVPFAPSVIYRNHYAILPSYLDYRGGENIPAPWGSKSGTAIPPTYAEISMGSSYPTYNFLAYRNEPVENLSARYVIKQGGDLFFSQRDSTNRPKSKHLFTNTLEEYFSQYTNMQAYNSEFLLGSPIKYNYTRVDPSAGPTSFELQRPDFVDDPVEKITSTSEGGIYLSARESVRSVVGKVENPKGTATLADTGASSNLVVDGNYIVFSGLGRAYQFRESEEAKGYLQNIINEEFEFPDKDISTVVSLFARHRIFLFHQRWSRHIYALSASTDRKVNGISVLELPQPVQSIKKLDADTILMQTRGTLTKMNFSADRNTVYKDFIPGGDPKTFDVSLTTLPVFVLTDTESSVFYRTSIPRAVVTLEGYPEFTMDVINQENKVIASRSLRKVGRDVSKTPYFSGAFLIDRLPTSATEQPRVRIRKNSENYIAFSSMVLDLGSTKRDTIGGKRRE